jgi:FK506-binding nuclear protein
MALLPMAVYGLEVPCGDIPVPAVADFPATFQITMAAIDPSAMPEGSAEEQKHPRATLKLLRVPIGGDDDYDSEDNSEDFDADEMERMLAGEDSEEDDSEDDEAAPGPSDPSKSKKARKAAAMEAIKKLLQEDEMDVDAKPNGKGKGKGKGKAPVSDDDEEEDDDEDDLEDDEEGEDEEIEEFVLCTLDTKSVSLPHCYLTT